MKRLLLISYIVLGVILIETLAVAYFDIPYLTSAFVKDISSVLTLKFVDKIERHSRGSRQQF